MERLTKELDDGRLMAYPNNDSGLPEIVLKSDPYYRIIEKLNEYQDLEEQGLLVKLPFSIGSRVFALWSTESGYTLYEAEVKEICIGTYHARKDIKYMIEPIGRRGSLFKYYSVDVGKTIFTDKQQAEQALKEMEGENE